MSMTSAAGGVCLACKFDPDCIYEAASGRTILQCEQFEMGFRQPAVQTPSLDELPFTGMPFHGRASRAYSGLCSNCDNRETCIYPKPEGGVWRCEEYL